MIHDLVKWIFNILFLLILFKAEFSDTKEQEKVIEPPPSPIDDDIKIYIYNQKNN